MPDQAEVAVGVADLQPEEERHEAVVHAPDHRAEQTVGPAQLVALHDVDVVRRTPHQELELGRIELAVTIGVEDPLALRRTEPGEQRAAVAAVALVGDDAQERLDAS